MDSESEIEGYQSSDGQSDFDDVETCQSVEASATPVAGTSSSTDTATGRPDVEESESPYESARASDKSDSSTDEVNV